MTKKSLEKYEAEERLKNLFLETRLGLELDDFMEELVPADDPWWGAHEGLDLEDVASETLPITLPWRNRLSSGIVTVSDWAGLAIRHLALGFGHVGTTKQVFSATKAAATEAPADYRRWKQGNIWLTLSVAKTKPFLVTLHIDEGPVLKISRMILVDMGSIESDPLQPPVLRIFDVTPRSDERTFTVVSQAAEIGRRLSAILAAEKKRTHDARLLLPFVEWD